MEELQTEQNQLKVSPVESLFLHGIKVVIIS